jgi:hypothetical protein
MNLTNVPQDLLTGRAGPKNRKRPIDEVDSWDASERFWRRVKITDGCWEWQGALTHYGYGHMSVNTHLVNTHRLSYLLAYGQFPTDLCVLHRCDNRRCVRPSHLFLGTHTDNMRDAVAKGRMTQPHVHKLTAEKVAEIRGRLEANPLQSNGKLGREYGVGRNCIRQIRFYWTWKSIEPTRNV